MYEDQIYTGVYPTMNFLHESRENLNMCRKFLIRKRILKNAAKKFRYLIEHLMCVVTLNFAGAFVNWDFGF